MGHRARSHDEESPFSNPSDEQWTANQNSVMPRSPPRSRATSRRCRAAAGLLVTREIVAPTTACRAGWAHSTRLNTSLYRSGRFDSDE